MLSLNPKDIFNKNTIFRNGTLYEKDSKVGLDKPDANELISNFSSTLGSKRGSEEYVQIASSRNVLKAQEKEKNVKIFNRYVKREKFIQKLRAPILFGKRLVPMKFVSFIRNLPEFTTKNIKSYIRAEVSNINQGPVSLPVYEERKKICGACPHRTYAEGYKDPLGFCTKCGCGANPRAQLTIKLKLPATSCPINKWGESKGIYEGFWGRIRYIIIRRFKNGSIQ
jgi:hypothetical protein